LVPCADAHTVLMGDLRGSPCFRLPNAAWRFKWAPNPASAPQGFYRTRFDDSGWGYDAIAVPGNWQLQGYGKPIYTDVQQSCFTMKVSCDTICADRLGTVAWRDGDQLT
jgi:beta-galactosidase/beta-glucuronidase